MRGHDGRAAPAAQPLTCGAVPTPAPPAPITTDPARAAAVLAAGGLVAFPTETVYGLGAHAELPDAVGRVFAAKGRPTGHPLIVHGTDAEVLDRYGRGVPPEARRLADALWPGPLTVVVARSGRVPDAVTGGRDTVGLRVPDQPQALAMLRALGAGVAAPSANPFGRTSPTLAAHVVADLGRRIDLVLDGGPSQVGVESTIVELTGPEPVLLRAGGIPVERLEQILGRPVRVTSVGPARAPGMLEAHYAPSARVVLVGAAEAADRAAREAAAGQRVVVLSARAPEGMPAGVRVLTPSGGSVEDYARELYALLRRADALGATRVLAVPPPERGVGVAVADRLRRAAAAG